MTGQQNKIRISVWLVSVFYLLAFAGCALQPSKDADVKNKMAEQGIPTWVNTAPEFSDSYDVVVSVPLASHVKVATQLAVEQGKQKILQQVKADITLHYLASVKPVEQSYGELERKVRLKVRASLPAMLLVDPTVKAVYQNKSAHEVSVWMQLTKQSLMQGFKSNLIQVDKSLRNYLHVGERGSDLAQLLSVIPALPALENRRRLEDAVNLFSAQPEVMPTNDELAMLLDTHITSKFDDLVVNINATTTDSKAYDLQLQQSLIKQGIPVNSRQPDLSIKYFLEFDPSIEKGQQKMTLVADSEMIDNKGSTFASVSKEYSELDNSQAVAKQKVMDAFTADMAQAIIDAAISYIDKVNKSQSFQKP